MICLFIIIFINLFSIIDTQPNLLMLNYDAKRLPISVALVDDDDDQFIKKYANLTSSLLLAADNTTDDNFNITELSPPSTTDSSFVEEDINSILIIEDNVEETEHRSEGGGGGRRHFTVNSWASKPLLPSKSNSILKSIRVTQKNLKTQPQGLSAVEGKMHKATKPRTSVGGADAAIRKNSIIRMPKRKTMPMVDADSQLKTASMVDADSNPSPYARHRRYTNGCCGGRRFDYSRRFCGIYRSSVPCIKGSEYLPMESSFH
jgi:hypothetical protein